MKVAVATICYREARLLPKFLDHIPAWVDTKLVLASTKPWNGDELPDDGTIKLAGEHGGEVIAYHWTTEEDQRNAGQEYLHDYDYIIILDPDEYLDNNGWDTLKQMTSKPATSDREAYVVQGQYTYWKTGYVADPPKDYQQLILVTPAVRFVDKRVVDMGYDVLPLWLHHMSWARTDAEVWSKISHYAHAKDFDIKQWYNNVWLKWKPGMQDVHPITPDTLHDLIEARLPKELEGLHLWPNNTVNQS